MSLSIEGLQEQTPRVPDRLPPNIALEMSATPHATTGFSLLGTVDETSRGFDKSYQILTSAHGESASQPRARGRGAGTGRNDTRNHFDYYHQLLPDGSLITNAGSMRAGLKPPSDKAMCVVSLALTTRSAFGRKRSSVHSDSALYKCLLARRARLAAESSTTLRHAFYTSPTTWQPGVGEGEREGEGERGRAPGRVQPGRLAKVIRAGPAKV